LLCHVVAPAADATIAIALMTSAMTVLILKNFLNMYVSCSATRSRAAMDW
jgi:hypothetical protein